MAERKYWKGIEQLNATDEVFNAGHSKEFAEELPTSNELEKFNLDNANSNRRDFLKMMGFSVTAAVLAASCEMPVRKAIPYLIKPDEVTPGIPNYYASSFYDGSDYGSVLVKTREGRPIKIEGNKKSRVTNGGTTAIAQASVLNLYDRYRGQSPLAGKEKTTWDKLDAEVKGKLAAIKTAGGNIRILSSSIISPSTKAAIKKFTEEYPKTEHVTYDAYSYSGLLNANEKSFGKRVLPGLLFDKATLIVSLGADFLGTWGSPVENAWRYAQLRKVSAEKPSMSRHIQVESYLSMTGSNADTRVVVKPSQEALAVAYLYNKVTGNGASVSVGAADEQLNSIATELKAAKPGSTIVVSGSNDENVQILVNGINAALGNIGATIDFANYSNLKQGDDKKVADLLDDLKGGKVAGLIIYEANPVYDLADAETVKAAIAKADLSVCLNERVDETSVACKYHAPNNHYLESWGDLEPTNGCFSFIQPTIAPLFDTRQASESLLRFAGVSTAYYDYVKAYWQQNILNGQANFNIAWDHAVANGGFEKAASAVENISFKGDATAASNAVKSSAKTGDGLEIVFYQKVGIRDGRNAGNPWLQELPDPVSKVTWDNYAAVSYQLAEKLGCKQASFRTGKGFGAKNGHGTYTDVITVKVDGKDLDLPVIIQPGTPENTIAVAIGYGHTAAGKTGSHVGENVYPFVKTVNGSRQFYATGATASVVAGKEFPIGQTQLHHTIDDTLNKRPLVKETVLGEYKKKPNAGNEDREEVKEHLTSLYDNYNYPGNKWGMAIDLNSCIGCGACVVACTAENNVPVVGKDEVRRSREMHWLRIDRYYAGNPDNPGVIFQPMLCQHCDQAPCENVCPVAATNHSSEGLNQMAYNRCIGTRYCANNCPYKVRRFNWFDYQNADSFKKGSFFDNEHDAAQMNEDLTRMVLNPDVTIRSRGVMEKCSFCVQRIQVGKLEAKKGGRKLKDGDIITACQSACPTHAIVFGNLNDKESEVRILSEDERGFKVLEEIHTMPAITYLTKVRNKANSEA